VDAARRILKQLGVELHPLAAQEVLRSQTYFPRKMDSLTYQLERDYYRNVPTTR
jgi:hypothetical protein